MRVFITGMGGVSSLGNGSENIFRGLLENKSGVRSIPEWKQYQGLHTHVGAPAADYDISKVPRSARRTMSRMSEMAVIATSEALRQADLIIGNHTHTPRVLLSIGSTTGSPETMIYLHDAPAQIRQFPDSEFQKMVDQLKALKRFVAEYLPRKSPSFARPCSRVVWFW